MKTPTEKQLQKAIAVISAYGRSSYKSPDTVSPGAAFGMGMAKASLRGFDLREACAEALEDQNFHAEAAILRVR